MTRTGFEDGLFSAWRDDPAFVLERPGLRRARPILVAGPEFGTGSSREHAVWALRDWGFRAVVSPRFGDIFRGNALKEGLLPVELEPQAVEELWDLVEADPTTPVDRRPGGPRSPCGQSTWAFPLDDFSRWRLHGRA